MQCPFCGEDIEDNSKFCTYCGSKIKDYSQTVAKLSSEEVDLYEYNKEKIDKLIRKNNLTLRQKRRIEAELRAESKIPQKNRKYNKKINKIISEEAEKNKNSKDLTPAEYQLIIDNFKRKLYYTLINEGLAIVQDLGIKVITETESQIIEETVPHVRNIWGTPYITTDYRTVQKRIPVQYEREVEDERLVIIKIRNNDLILEDSETHRREIIDFEEIKSIYADENFISIQLSGRTLNFKQSNDFYIQNLDDAISEEIYYLKDYKAIENKYLNQFRRDFQNEFAYLITQSYSSDRGYYVE